MSRLPFSIEWRMMKRFVTFRKVAALAVLLAAAVLGFTQVDARADWALHDVRGHLPRLAFTLTDDENRLVSANDYRGDIVLLYFGFTGCSDQCPLAMQRAADLIRRLKGDKAHIRVLFVSIDPDHDTPARLKNFLSHFDATHMAGLTGDTAAIAALAKRYRTAWRPGSNVSVSHGDTIYIFDGKGNARLLLTPQDATDAALADIERLRGGA